MKVSVIIPVYNSQKTIKKAVDSVLNQDFPQKDFEVIVVNDGSTDSTPEILKSYKGQVRTINQKNQGAVKAANRGFKSSRGKYVIKLDADDFFEPTILKEMVAILEKNPRINFVYSDYYERPLSGKVKIISPEINMFNTVAIGIMFRKNQFARSGFYNEETIFAEYDLLLRTLGKWKGYYVPKSLFWYNRKRRSLSKNKRLVKAALNQLKKLHPQKIKEIKKIRKY